MKNLEMKHTKAAQQKERQCHIKYDKLVQNRKWDDLLKENKEIKEQGKPTFWQLVKQIRFW